MEKSPFGERLRLAFQNANNAKIAREIGVSPSSVVNYMSGRIPEMDKLLKIKAVTQCDLNWLITGEGGTEREGVALPERLDAKLSTIAHEQSHALFAEAELGGANMDAKTRELLVEYTIARGMKSLGLIESESDVMSKEDLKRAQKFGFVGYAPSAIESYIREIVRDSAPLGATNEVRDIIREIVREEVDRAGSVKVYNLPIRDDESQEEQPRRRKAG